MAHTGDLIQGMGPGYALQVFGDAIARTAGRTAGSMCTTTTAVSTMVCHAARTAVQPSYL